MFYVNRKIYILQYIIPDDKAEFQNSLYYVYKI